MPVHSGRLALLHGLHVRTKFEYDFAGNSGLEYNCERELVVFEKMLLDAALACVAQYGALRGGEGRQLH